MRSPLWSLAFLTWRLYLQTARTLVRWTTLDNIGKIIQRGGLLWPNVRLLFSTKILIKSIFASCYLKRKFFPVNIYRLIKPIIYWYWRCRGFRPIYYPCQWNFHESGISTYHQKSACTKDNTVYRVHAGKSYYNDICTEISSGISCKHMNEFVFSMIKVKW